MQIFLAILQMMECLTQQTSLQSLYFQKDTGTIVGRQR